MSENRGRDSQEDNSDAYYKCGICLETAEYAMVTFCGHLFCYECIFRWIHIKAGSPKCPICYSCIGRNTMIPLRSDDDEYQLQLPDCISIGEQRRRAGITDTSGFFTRDIEPPAFSLFNSAVQHSSIVPMRPMPGQQDVAPPVEVIHFREANLMGRLQTCFVMLLVLFVLLHF